MPVCKWTVEIFRINFSILKDFRMFTQTYIKTPKDFSDVELNLPGLHFFAFQI